MTYSNVQIARICHQTNKAFCEALEDFTQKDWDSAEQWQRDSAIKGVAFALANPDAPASTQHDAWLADKKADGWKYGAVKSPAAKLHPCMVPYEDLPLDQRMKDYLFKGVVAAFARASQE